MRTYEPELLALPDVASIEWAAAWVRATLRDTPNAHDAYPEGSYLDAEISGQLALTAVAGPDGPLYRPHEAAATLIEADPRRTLAFSVGGLSETLPDAKTVAAGIRKAGASIDALVLGEGGTVPNPGRVTMNAVF